MQCYVCYGEHFTTQSLGSAFAAPQIKSKQVFEIFLIQSFIPLPIAAMKRAILEHPPGAVKRRSEHQALTAP